MPEATTFPDAAALALLALSATVAGAFGAVFGLGAGVLLSFAVSAVYGVDAVVPMITTAMLVANAGRIVAYRGAVEGRTLAVALAAAAPAAVAGAHVQASLPAWAVAGAIGLILVASVPIGRMARARNLSLSPISLALLSAALGLVGSLGISAGALAIPVLLGAGLAGPALIATDAALAVGTSIVRTGTFALLGVLTPDRLLAALAIGAATLPGAWLGAMLVRRAGVRRHALAVEAFALVAGILYLWQALRLA
ncbi:TSUP family transporter [Alsobacter sp. R-9]